jgi:hypothetical protein
MTRRSAALGAAIALGVLAAGLALVLLMRATLAGWIAVRTLASLGIPAELTVTQVGARGGVLAPLRVEVGETLLLSAERVALDWSWRGLRAGRVEHVTATGVRVEGSVALPELAAAAEEESEPFEIALPALPTRSATLRDVRVELDTSKGRVSLRGGGAALFANAAVAGSFTLAGDTPYGPIEARVDLAGTREAPEARFDVSGTPRSDALPVPLEAPLHATGRLHPDASGAPRWQTALTLPFFEWPELVRFEEIAVEAEGDRATLRAKLHAARAIDLREPPLLAPVSLDLELHGPFDALAFSGRSRTQDGGYTCELSGTLQPFAREARVSFRLPETQVGEKTRQPPRVSPRIGAIVQQARGFVGANGLAHFAQGELSWQADVAFRELDLRTTAATLRGLTGAVTFMGPPFATPPGQLVSIAAIEDPLPLANGLIEFQLTREGAVALASAVFAVAKGQLSASGLLPLDAQERSIELAAKDLDVATLLEALPFAALSGTGTLEGTLPLRQRGTNVRIENGQLRATRPGVLRYRAEVGSAAAAEQQSQLGVVFGALENLEYETLELGVSGDTAQELNVAVRVVGRNPNFENGRPVHLNVNVEAQLGDLVKVGQAAYRVPGEVEERVKRILDQEKR